jgi:hypothetical protein
MSRLIDNGTSMAAFQYHYQLGNAIITIGSTSNIFKEKKINEVRRIKCICPLQILENRVFHCFLHQQSNLVLGKVVQIARQFTKEMTLDLVPLVKSRLPTHTSTLRFVKVVLINNYLAMISCVISKSCAILLRIIRT